MNTIAATKSLSTRLSCAKHLLSAADTAPALDVVQAADNASKALAAVGEAKDPNAVAAALDAARTAMEEFESCLAMSGLAGDQLVATSLGPVGVTAAQLVECKRAGADPKVFAERLAASAQARAPSEATIGGRTVATSRGPVTLTANQLAECARVGADPAVFAENASRPR